MGYVLTHDGTLSFEEAQNRFEFFNPELSHQLRSRSHEAFKNRPDFINRSFGGLNENPSAVIEVTLPSNKSSPLEPV